MDATNAALSLVSAAGAVTLAGVAAAGAHLVRRVRRRQARDADLAAVLASHATVAVGRAQGVLDAANALDAEVTSQYAARVRSWSSRTVTDVTFDVQRWVGWHRQCVAAASSAVAQTPGSWDALEQLEAHVAALGASVARGQALLERIRRQPGVVTAR